MSDEAKAAPEVVLQDALQGFLEACKDSGLKKKTVTEYEANVKRLLAYLETQGIRTAEQVTRKVVRSFVGSLGETTVLYEKHRYRRPVKKSLSRISIQDIAVTNKRFWYWMLEEEYIENNPFWKVRLPRPGQRLPPLFNDEEVQALLDAIDISLNIGIRDWAMVVLFLDTGIRLSELISLTLKTVDLGRRIL